MSHLVLQVSGVSVDREGQRILDAVDWSVRSDENWAIIGPNGAGKSTLFSLAASRCFPTVGGVEILGSQLGQVDVRKLRKRIAHSGASLMRDLPSGSRAIDLVCTGTNSVLSDWWTHPTADERNLAMDLLSDLGISHVCERSFVDLSEGERQKVLLARALMSSAELYLLDEVFSGLDAASRERLIKRLDVISRDTNKTLILITHYLEHLPPSISHVALMKDGRIVDQGEIDVTLNSKSMSDLFDYPLVVKKDDFRWRCQAV